MKTWTEVWKTLPPEGKTVLTKIEDDRGTRNIQTLVRKGSLWFLPDMSMYVYYSPTHWQLI